MYKKTTRRLIGKIYRETTKLFHYRPTSYPYISGDGFRALADYVYDDFKKSGPEKITEANKIVFVQSDKIKEWFENIHPHIKVRYKLITHNSDATVGKNEVKYIDDKIIHWFAQNVTITHPKITPIPIGLENLHYYQNGVTRIFNELRTNKNTSKESAILFGFNISTNPSKRQKAYNVLCKTITAKKIDNWPDPVTYLQILKKYMFIASPEGNGLDCHRTWEAIYLGVVPIVIRSVSTEHFKRIGFAILIIDDYNEVANMDHVQLKELYHQLKSETFDEVLWLNYWKDLIDKKL